MTEIEDIFMANQDSLMQTAAELPPTPLVYGTLKIDMRLMTPEQQQKLFSAIQLLHEAGVSSAGGMGFGHLDFELDWALKGAHLRVRQPRCSGCNQQVTGEAIQATVQRHTDGHIFPNVYHLDCWDPAKSRWAVLATESRWCPDLSVPHEMKR